MWQVIGQISSIFGLLAFVAAVIGTIWRRALLNRERMIATAPEEQRGTLIAAVLDRVVVETQGLTREQRFQLAQKTLGDRAARFRLMVLVAVPSLALFALLAIFGLKVVPEWSQRSYRVQVTVLDSRGFPVPEARVSSSAGGELQQTQQGWEITLPVDSVPADHRIRVDAARGSDHGSAELELGRERVLSLVVNLAPPVAAMVRGTVRGPDQRVLAGARVSVVGHEAESVETDGSGSFALAAHVGAGEDVRLHVEHKDYSPADQYHVAGDEPAVIVLEQP